MFTMMKLKKIVSEAGLIGDGLKVVSKNKNNDSWDWYGVEVYYHKGDIKQRFLAVTKINHQMSPRLKKLTTILGR